MNQHKIFWRKPDQGKPPSRNTFNTDFSPALPELTTNSRSFSLLRDTLLITGIPTVEGARTPKEDAIGLLMLAAEVEHALMVQYLYAAQSLRGAAARTVAHIAVQEMGHLITLQNILLSLTGVSDDGIPTLIHLGRDNLRRHSDINPLTFSLEKITHTTLGKFVVIERPEEISDPELRRRVSALEAEAVAAGDKLHPVFALYAAIRWLFQPSDEVTGELDQNVDLGFRPGWHLTEQDFVSAEIIDRFASTATEWHSIPSLIVAKAHNNSEALAAIDAITAQGEGILGVSDSHFAKYVELLDSFESGGVRVKSLPRTPYVIEQTTPEDLFPTEITNNYTRLWAHLFNLQYELLLVDIAWAISQANDNPARTPMIDISVDGMNKVIQPLSNDMTERVLDNKNPMKAGPPYGLTNEFMPSSIAEFRIRFDSLLSRQATLFEQIHLAPEFSMDTVGNIRLSDIIQQNDARTPYLPIPI